MPTPQVMAVQKVDEFTLEVTRKKRDQVETKAFTFDMVFDPQVTQEEVFEEVRQAS